MKFLTPDDTKAIRAERRERLARSFEELLVESGIDVERGKAAFLAYTRWHAMADVPDEHWMDCPYPGAVIEALKAYEKK